MSLSLQKQNGEELSTLIPRTGRDLNRATPDVGEGGFLWWHTSAPYMQENYVNMQHKFKIHIC